MATGYPLPNLSDQVVLVTGANSGLGLHASKAFAEAGARVLLACRDASKAEAAMAQIRASARDARLQHVPLDLASLRSIRAAAERVCAEHERIDILYNNAGVMAVPRSLTEDGFEMQLGVNHFGHFALTGLLLAPLLRAPAARVVTVSSQAHRIANMRMDDLDGARRYHKWDAYGQSKLANLLFAFELQRRFERAGASAISVACHPGYAATNLQLVGPALEQSALMAGFYKASNAVFAQSAEQGVLPILRAATDPEVRGGECYGPAGVFQWFGKPVRVEVRKRAHDPVLAKQLWDVSVQRTGVDYAALTESRSA